VSFAVSLAHSPGSLHQGVDVPMNESLPAKQRRKRSFARVRWNVDETIASELQR
jgi:hypothetical protein